jgi:hypothetical protein
VEKDENGFILLEELEKGLVVYVYDLLNSVLELLVEKGLLDIAELPFTENGLLTI